MRQIDISVVCVTTRLEILTREDVNLKLPLKINTHHTQNAEKHLHQIPLTQPLRNWNANVLA